MMSLFGFHIANCSVDHNFDCKFFNLIVNNNNTYNLISNLNRLIIKKEKKLS